MNDKKSQLSDIRTRPALDIVTPVPDAINTRDDKAIKPHMTCPNCGQAGRCDGSYKKASTLTKRYYRCTNCPRTWVIDFKPEEARNNPE